MKKLFSLAFFLGLSLAFNSAIYAQEGQNPPPPKEGKRGMKPGDEHGMHGGGPEDGRGPGGMRGGLGFSEDELLQLNLTDDQKVKLFDLRKKMFAEHQAMMKENKPERKPDNDMNPDEMRQLMSAKSLGTLTPEQKTKLDAMEAKHKEMREKRQASREQMKSKMEAAHKELLSILTPDQIKQLEKLRAEKFKKMEERRKNAPQGKSDGNPGN